MRSEATTVHGAKRNLGQIRVKQILACSLSRWSCSVGSHTGFCRVCVLCLLQCSCVWTCSLPSSAIHTCWERAEATVKLIDVKILKINLLLLKACNITFCQYPGMGWETFDNNLLDLNFIHKVQNFPSWRFMTCFNIGCFNRACGPTTCWTECLQVPKVPPTAK